MSPEKKVVKADKAPQAIGPYSAAITAGHWIFTAGQIGIERSINDLVPGGIEAETRQALKNLQYILESAGSSLQEVVKTTVFMRDMNDFSIMNGVYAEFFSSEPPARSTIQVAALPKGAAVEIEAVATKPL